MIDYTIFYKERFTPEEFAVADLRWDVLIAAYDETDRSKAVAGAVSATERIKVDLPEYDPPTSTDGVAHFPDASDVTDFATRLVDRVGALKDRTLCVDISAFITHYVLVLLNVLHKRGVKKFDILYAEPIRYKAKEQTKFSDEVVLDVKQLPGYEGVHTTDTDHDLLVLAVGYDHQLVIEVAGVKEHSKKVQIFGLPSLRPDMYQEGILRARQAAEAVGSHASDPENFRFAPANDPFVTASVVAEIVAKHRDDNPGANVYLAPLSTKAQALGMGIYFITEGEGQPTSVLYPSFKRHERNTSEGVSGFWKYTIQLP